MLLDGRGLLDGNSSKKALMLGEALSGGGKLLPVDTEDTALGGRGTGGPLSRDESAPVNMLLLLGGGGRAGATWASDFGCNCW